MIACYFRLLIFRPVLVISLITLVSAVCIALSLSLKSLPDFTDPTKGFEARGTDIGQKLTAWMNLLEATRPSGFLVTNPNDLLPPPENAPKHRRKKIRNQKKKQQKMDLNKKIKILKNYTKSDSGKPYDFSSVQDMFEENENDNETRHVHWDYGKNMSYDEENFKKSLAKKTNRWKELNGMNPPPLTTISADGSFCESPSKEYMHFVIKRINQLNESLFEINALLDMCDLEQRIIETNDYDDLCQRELNSNSCCRPWSLPNYVALLSNKTSCFDINDEDVQMVKSLLFDCYQYYSNLKLGNDCVESKCHAPEMCTQQNAVYNILHFLADREFMKLNESIEYLSTAMIFFPVARSTKALPLFHNFMKKNLNNDLVGVVAMDMGLKNALFDECLLLDGWLVAMGGFFVLACMWMYTVSFFVTFMTVIAIVFSLGIAYFIYSFIFNLTFFPFMNLLTVIVVVGIGSDDAFIFLKIWQCVLTEKMKTPATTFAADRNTHTYDNLVNVMSMTLRHASISMLVTSLTTASAFYASMISSITAVRCFGIFAGTAVMTNYFLMITWLPASVSLAERFHCGSVKSLNAHSKKTSKFVEMYGKLYNRFEDCVISLILNFPVFWIVILGLFGITCGVFVLYWPKLKLPDSPDFKLFVEDHIFELYDTKYKDLFWFEKIYTSSDSFKLPLRFVWGVQPVDSGNYLDPSSRGKLFLDESFNVSSKESQVWLLKFCKDLKKQPFYQANVGTILVPNCFIENLISWMSRKCLDSMSDLDRSPCCEISTFPFAPEIFDYCLPESISALYATPRDFFLPGVAGPKFEKYNVTSELYSINNFTVPTKVKALVVESDSTQSFSMSFTEIDKFVETVQNWLDLELESAPPGMRNAFFITDLDFFDLQGTLSRGTINSIGVAMSVALLVLLLFTLNILVSLYAIITVTFTIFSIVGTLVLLGWKLNVLESVAIATAIGLGVDFSLHYGVQYRYATEKDRKASTKCALQRMFGPTGMAATTTGIAGAMMLPSNVLAYIQIGVFLVVSMVISWVFSTFFLMSLLSAIGPQYGFGQFKLSLPKFHRVCENNKNIKAQIDIINNTITQQNHASEQLLSASSSATCEFVGSEETHELDSLTSSSLVKTLTIDSNSHPVIRPSSFDRSFKIKNNYPKDNSPSTASAITVLPDDSEFQKI